MGETSVEEKFDDTTEFLEMVRLYQNIQEFESYQPIDQNDAGIDLERMVGNILTLNEIQKTDEARDRFENLVDQPIPAEEQSKNIVLPTIESLKHNIALKSVSKEFLAADSNVGVSSEITDYHEDLVQILEVGEVRRNSFVFGVNGIDIIKDFDGNYRIKGRKEKYSGAQEILRQIDLLNIESQTPEIVPVDNTELKVSQEINPLTKISQWTNWNIKNSKKVISNQNFSYFTFKNVTLEYNNNTSTISIYLSSEIVDGEIETVSPIYEELELSELMEKVKFDKSGKSVIEDNGYFD